MTRKHNGTVGKATVYALAGEPEAGDIGDHYWIEVHGLQIGILRVNHEGRPGVTVVVDPCDKPDGYGPLTVKVEPIGEVFG